MKLFCGRTRVVHQLCPTEGWWCYWWQSKELPSSAAFVDYMDWNVALWVLRLPFLTIKNTFSTRKMATFYLADTLPLTKAASFHTFQGGKAGFQTAAVSVEHTFLYLTLPKIQEKENRTLESHVKKTLRYERHPYVELKRDFPRWPHCCLLCWDKGRGGSTESTFGSILCHCPQASPGSDPGQKRGLTNISVTAVHLQKENTLMSRKHN